MLRGRMPGNLTLDIYWSTEYVGFFGLNTEAQSQKNK